MAFDVDAQLLQKMFIAGTQALYEKREWINELNVFPVPDGDTGTNMTMTIIAAANEVMALEDPTIEEVCKAIAKGSLRGARGNSGVILSQLLKGFTRAFMSFETIGVSEVIASFNKATDTAYKAVMKPKEGTILTVQKGMSDKASELSDCEDILEAVRQILEKGDEVLLQTPEMLPVLKQAGVVDSGGQGLMVVLHGMFEALCGKEIEMVVPSMSAASESESGSSVDTSSLETSEIKFGYCTEFIIMLEKKFTDEDEKEFKGYLSSIGDSIVCVPDDELVKIHVHTNDPGLAIQKALTYGSLTRMKIDNMREEHQERLFKNSEAMARKQKKKDEKEAAKQMPHKDLGIVSVSCGEGLENIMKDLGVDKVISGGQTMNPSTEDILEAVSCVNADHVFIFPNNKNIILAANQAKDLCTDKDIIVIPTKTVCQGLGCLLDFIPESGAEENEQMFLEHIALVKTVEVTYAIRSTCIDGVEIHENDYMSIGDEGIICSTPDITEAVKQSVGKLVNEDTAMITLYYGQDVKKEEAEALCEMLEEIAGDAEVEIQFGGQPVYYYLISIEE